MANNTRQCRYGAALLAGGFILSRYRVCSASQYMVRTGLGINDMSVSRKGVHWPLQKLYVPDMTPKNYRFQLHNMSRELCTYFDRHT